jgi:hypothetical protein
MQLLLLLETLLDLTFLVGKLALVVSDLFV